MHFQGRARQQAGDQEDQGGILRGEGPRVDGAPPPGLDRLHPSSEL